MADFLASSVGVAFVPVLDDFHKKIKKELNLEATGRDLSDDLMNPLKKEAAAAAKDASKTIDKEMGKAGKNAKWDFRKPFGAAGHKAGQKFANSVNSAIKNGIKVAGVAALAGGALFLKDAITEASNLEQSVGALESVFKENAGQMQKYSDEAAQTMGLSKNQYNELATILGTQLKAGGLDGSALTSEVQNLTLLGADLSSMYGGTTPEAVEALSAALRGEMEPARRYGITLDQAAIQNKALEMGLISAGEEMDQNAKTQATLALITEQTADASGNFARENDTLAGKTARARAAFDNMKATVGEALLPALTSVMEVVNTSVIPGLVTMAEKVKPFVDFIGNNLGAVAGFAGALGTLALGLYTAGGGFTPLITKIQSLFGFFKKGWGKIAGFGKKIFTLLGSFRKGFAAIRVAMLAIMGPVGWIITGVVALGAALTLFFTKTETGRQMWSKIWAGIKSAAAAVVTWFQETALPFLQKVWEKIVDGATWLWEKMKLVWQGVKLGVQAFIAWAREELVPRFKAIWESISESAMNLWDNHLKPAFEKVKNGIMPVIDWVKEKLGGLFGGREAKSGVEKLAGSFKLITDVAKTVFNVLKAVFSGITWVLENILLPVFKVVFAAIGWVVTIAVNVIEAVIKGLIWFWQNVLWPVLQWLWKNVFVPVFNGIVAVVKIAIGVVTAIIQGLVWFWQNVLSPVLNWLWGVFKVIWNAIKIAVAIVVTAVIVIIKGLVALWQYVLAPVLTWLLENVFKPVWNGIKAAISAVVDWFKNTAWPLLSLVIDWIKLKFEHFKIRLGIIWNFIKNNVINPVVAWFQNVVWPILSLVIDWLKSKFENFKNNLGIIWNFIKNNVINPVVAWFRDTAWPLFRRVVDLIKNKFENFKNNLKRIWNFIKDNVINPVVTWFQDKIKPKIDEVVGGIENAFETMRDNIGKAWDKVKSLVSEPIEFVVNTVLNKGIIKTFNDVAKALGIDTRLPEVSFNGGDGKKSRGGGRNQAQAAYASGGVMPGYSPGRDVHQFYSPTGGRLDLSGGEAVMRPEWTRAVGRGFVDSMNAAARSRGAQGVRDLLSGDSHQAFKNGGIINWFGDLAGDAWDLIKDAAGKAADFMSDPVGMFGKIADSMFEGMPGSGVMFDAAKKLPRKIIEGIKESFDKSEEAAIQATGGPVGPVPPGANRSLSYAGQLARSMGLRFTSGYRAGARTRRTGSVSYHALGRAHDYAGSGSQMSAFFDALHPLKPTELLYSPKGGRQWRRWGAQAQTSGSTYRGHFDHVHVAFKKGGIMPDLHDNGGVLHPGLSFISNKTRKPEAILTDRQWDTAFKAMDRQTTAGNINQTFNIRDTDATVSRIASEVDWAMRSADIRGRI